MVLSISIHSGLIKLKEVDSEEEAFYEMRRYMKVNNIYSDITTLRKYTYTDHSNVTEELKLVNMHTSYLGQDDLVFAVHYQTQPEYSSLEEAIEKNSHLAYCFEKYQNERDKYSRVNSLRFPRLRLGGTSTDAWLPEELDIYIADLTKRGGDVYCH